MKPLKHITFFLSSSLTFLLLFSCSLDTPSQPAWDNPFDPDNPDTHGDPYQIRAEIVDEGIQVSWNYIEWNFILGYNLYRKVDAEGFVNIRQTGYSIRDITFLDTDVSGVHRYEYYVVARFADGEADPNNARTAVVNSIPTLTIAGGAEFTTTRQVELTITAFGADSMEIVNDSTSFAPWQAFASEKTWQLAAGEGTKTVFLLIISA